jgi:two-component system, OmpR family, phosphate regulon sensor histidine kinase PhoR
MSKLQVFKNTFTDKQFAATLPDAVIALDLDHRLLWWNPAAKKLLKFKKQDVATSIIEIFPQKQFQDYLQLCNSKKPLEINAPKDANVHLAIQIFSYGKTARLLIARDVTHTYHLEKMRQDFVANVSHELRTPLTVFRGYLELLLEKANHKKTSFEATLKQMYAQSVRMEHIIEDLLLLSRLEIDLPDAESLEPIDIHDLLNAIYRDALALSGDRKHHIHLKITGPAVFYGKREELRSAFSNLVFNAVHYTPRDGHIYMDWYQNKRGTHFAVRDTGIGIEAKHIPRLTERFYRVDAGRTRDTGGTGLGLAIVKHVLLRHRAYLEIKSELHRGSVFRCDFH